MEFNEWLVEQGHVSDVSEIQFELSAEELDHLYDIFCEETYDW